MLLTDKLMLDKIKGLRNQITWARNTADYYHSQYNAYPEDRNRPKWLRWFCELRLLVVEWEELDAITL